MKLLAPLFVAVGVVLALTTGTASVQSASLEMPAHPDRVVLGEPVIFTITKTNMLPPTSPGASGTSCRRA